MAGGGETMKVGASSGGAREVIERPNAAGELLSRRDEVVDSYPGSFGSIAPPDAVMERQRSAGRRRIPSGRFRPPAPRQYDVNKKQSSNREVEEGEGSGSHADGPTTEMAPVTSSLSNEDCRYRNPAPKAPTRDPVYDDLYSGEIKQDVAFRGDWWRGGVYY